MIYHLNHFKCVVATKYTGVYLFIHTIHIWIYIFSFYISFTFFHTNYFLYVEHVLSHHHSLPYHAPPSPVSYFCFPR